MDTLIEFAKIILPAALVLYAMYLGIKIMIDKELISQKAEIRGKSIEITLPVRLQAYERICLFLERISPNNIVVRLNESGLSAREFHQKLLKDIRDEFNHNVSQQVYMTDDVWSKVITAKEDLITDLNATAEGMSEGETSIDFAKKLFEREMNKNIDPIRHAINSLKDEISQTF